MPEPLETSLTLVKRTCTKCFHASPIIPSTASRNCCPGTSQRNSLQDHAAQHTQPQCVKTVCDRRLLNTVKSFCSFDIAHSTHAHLSRPPLDRFLTAE
jgi:hypothetical protein